MARLTKNSYLTILPLVFVLFCVLGIFLAPKSNEAMMLIAGNTGGGGFSGTETWGDGASDCDGTCTYTSAVQETYIYNASGYDDRNYGAQDGAASQDYTMIGTANSTTSTYTRGLLWFDIGDQKQTGTVTITSATLYVYCDDHFGDPATNPVKIFPALVDWGQNDAENSSNHECYEGDTSNSDPPASTSGNEPTWEYREDYSTTAWNTAGCDAATSGIDGDVTGDYDGSYDRGYTAIGSYLSDMTNGAYNGISINATGLDVLEVMMNNPTYNYGLLVTIIDSEDTDSYEALRYETKETASGHPPYLSITYTTE